MYPTTLALSIVNLDSENFLIYLKSLGLLTTIEDPYRGQGPTVDFTFGDVEKDALQRNSQIFPFDQGRLLNKGPKMDRAAGKTDGNSIFNRFHDNMNTGFVIPTRMGHFKVWFGMLSHVVIVSNGIGVDLRYCSVRKRTIPDAVPIRCIFVLPLFMSFLFTFNPLSNFFMKEPIS